MKNFLTKILCAVIAAIAVCAFGCGDAQEDIDTAGDEIELGTVRQALTSRDGYGTLTNMNRCWTDNHQFGWVGGTCDYPNPARIVYFNKRPSTCTGTYAADYAAAMTTAVNLMAGEISNAGWTVLASDQQLRNKYTISVTCGSPFSGSGSNAGGGTTFIRDPLNCTSQQDGQSCVHGDTESRLYLTKVNSSMSGVVSATARRKYMTTLFAHELGHSVGLGHEDGTPNGEANCLQTGLPVAGGAQLMDGGGCQGGLTPPQWFQASLTSFERDMLSAYH